MIKNKLHIERLKKIRPFVKFNYNINEIKSGNLSNYDKAKIKRYFDEINDLTSHPHYVYNPRSKYRRKAAVEYANQKNLRELKYVFLPTTENSKKPKLNFNKDGLSMVEEHVTRRAALFNKKALIKDADKEIDRAKAKLKKSKRFTVMCGTHESIKNITSANMLNGMVKEWMERYKETDKWLNGIYGYEIKNQSSFNEYTRAKKKARDKYQATTKRDKRRNKMINQIDFALETTTDPELRNALLKRKNNLRSLLGK